MLGDSVIIKSMWCDFLPFF